MTNLRWKKIIIKLNNKSIFNGYFGVNSENIITYFFNENDVNTNILQIHTNSDNLISIVINGAGVDNLFVNNDFTNGGTNINDIPFLSILYPDAIAWQLLSNSTIRYKKNDERWYSIDNLEKYSVTFENIEYPLSNICFPAKTPIRTDSGLVNIEEINPSIHTIRNKKIIEITKTITQDKYLVCFEKDSLGNNMPSQKTIISINHKIFYKGHMIKAKDFINKLENVYEIEYSGEILYNVLMEDYNKMVVNNLICETLNPKNPIAQLHMIMQKMNYSNQIQIINEYNNFVMNNTIFSN